MTFITAIITKRIAAATPAPTAAERAERAAIERRQQQDAARG